MRRSIFAFSLVVAALVPHVAVQAQGSHCDDRCSEEPCLAFLDDLLSFPRGTCRRNPYEERMETERHDFTQSTTTVGRGVFQVESGYLYLYKDAHGEVESSHSTPEMLLRYGLSDDIEVRLRWNYAWRFIEDEPDLQGAQDMIWSVKLQMTEARGWCPESALEIRSSVPTGGSDFSIGKVKAGFSYIYGWELMEDVTLYGSTVYAPNGLGEFSLVPEEPEAVSFDVWAQSAALGAELTEKNTAYIEWFGLFSNGLEEEFTLSFVNAGFDHYFSDNFLIDFRVGMGLTEDSEDFFTGIGGGARF